MLPLKHCTRTTQHKTILDSLQFLPLRQHQKEISQNESENQITNHKTNNSRYTHELKS